MAVTLGTATGESSTASGTTVSIVNLTIGAGITALLGVLSLGNSSGSDPTGVT